ncbi:MAG: tripartite tricarboxylate transporter substrate binding protein [Sulfuricaulis sp.]|nr:tripartite tricarboxylate transporter substrate binding protein [Sulfuricaulis sp.]
MKRFIRNFFLTALAAIALPAFAQDYPNKPVRVVLFYATGGATDFITRVVSEKLQQKLGQPFLVESRAGANLRIGSEFVAKSAPDGYTIGVTGTPHATNPALFSTLSYDTLKDLAGLAYLVDAPIALSVNPASPVKSVSDLIQAAKAKPGQLTMATAGNGTGPHLAMELLFLVAGTSFTHIPYKGDAPAVTEALAGRVDAATNTFQSVQQHIRAGKLRGLAVTTRQRLPALPDVPTVAEQGFPDVVVTTWFGMVIPAAVPRDIVNRLNREINAALALPDVREKVAGAGLIPVGGTPEQFDAHIRSEMERWARVIKTRGIKIE